MSHTASLKKAFGPVADYAARETSKDIDFTTLVKDGQPVDKETYINRLAEVMAKEMTKDEGVRDMWLKRWEAATAQKDLSQGIG